MSILCSEKKKRLLILALSAFSGLFLLACTGNPVTLPTATPTPTPTNTNTPTPKESSPIPSATFTPSPTATNTPTPITVADPYNIYWWVQESCDETLLTAQQIANLNRSALKNSDTKLYNMQDSSLWINYDVYQAINSHNLPDKKLYLDGKLVSDTARSNLYTECNAFDLIQNPHDTVFMYYGIATSNASIRTFPTSSRYTDSDKRFDYCQETRINIGEPLLILHYTIGREWYFVQSLTYSGWIHESEFGFCSATEYDNYVKKRYSADSRKVVAAYSADISLITHREPYEVTFGVPSCHSCYIREGSYFYTSDKSGSFFEFPVRMSDGNVKLLSMKVAEGSADPFIMQESDISSKKLLTYAANLLTTPYSWGDEAENGTDCSSTMQSIYSIFGLLLPRNTSSQMAFPLSKKDISGMSNEAKIKYLSEQPAGSLIYMKGHVMMLLGEYEGKIYILHNTTSYTDDNGKTTNYNSCVITTMDIGKSGNTLLDRCSMVLTLSDK